jgi:hypothetical protein
MRTATPSSGDEDAATARAGSPASPFAEGPMTWQMNNSIKRSP